MKQLVISVHGIRTFGGWQERLAQLLRVTATDREITVTNYKFGYFSVVAFLIPFFRWIVVRHFRNFLVDQAKDQTWDRIDLVGHSFGTHVIAWALYGIPEQKRPPVHTIIFASSVLKSNFPWQALLNHPVKRVINDCAAKDAVLLLSQLMVLFTGMAGRLGFNGGTGNNFINRYFDYGHSDYFLVNGRPDDLFMQTYWVPLLVTDAQPVMVDSRRANAFHGVLFTLLNNAEPIKLVIYVTPVLLIALWINHMREEAVTEKQRAEQSFEAANRLLTNLVEVVSENVAQTAQLRTVESLVRNIQQAIEGLPADSDAQLTMQHARISLLLAALKLEQGDTSGMYTNARDAHNRMASLNPTVENNPEALHLLASSNALLALYYETSLQPDFSRARKSYEEAIGQLQQLEKRFDKSGLVGDNWRWLRSLALARRDFGDFLLSKMAKLDEAAKAFKESRETFQKLKRFRRVDIDIDYDLAWAANKSGDVLYQQGKFDEALDQFELARKEIVDLGEPYLWSNPGWRRSLSIVYGNIGLCLRQRGKFEQAVGNFTKSEEEVKKLNELDPQRVDWRETLAWTHDVIGETEIMWGRSEQDEALLEKAGAELDAAKAMRDALVNEGGGVQRLTDEREITLANIATLEGTREELAGNFRNAALDFLRAAEINPYVTDERQEEMVWRRVTFLKSAGVDYLKAERRAEGRKQLEEAWQIANKEIATAVYPKPFSEICSELQTLLSENQP
jgi:tetratricopeptide (TPR) repeat protein/pimeloyl-ACP methyl ester carboxylesterase